MRTSSKLSEHNAYTQKFKHAFFQLLESFPKLKLCTEYAFLKKLFWQVKTVSAIRF